MDLQLTDQTFLVGGATSGLGRGVAEALLAEGANVIATARSADQLAALRQQYGPRVETHALDLTDETAIHQLLVTLRGRTLAGVLVNAGGPPAMPALDTELSDWDAAYRSLLRWKVQLIQGLLPAMQARGMGRFVLVESMSVKQPVANLVLSNALRLAVVGYIKTLAQEVAHTGVTFNILAPGYHATPRIDDLLTKNSERTGQSKEVIEQGFRQQIPVGSLGDPTDFGRLAAWLFSPHSRYLTGQTISVDGGVVKGAFG